LDTERGSLFEHILDVSDILLAGAVVWVEIVNGVFLKKRIKRELFGGKESGSQEISSIDKTIGHGTSEGIDTLNLVFIQTSSNGLESIHKEEQSHINTGLEEVPCVGNDAIGGSWK
jgi:hypothetical protein